MIDFTIIVIAVCLVLLSAAVARINDKIEKHIARFKRFEDALKKNATGKVSSSYSDVKEPQEVT
jgi:hypothetical protein